MPLTVAILTHNEASNIEACIKSCQFADEILVVDDNSSDDTVSIAKALGARVEFRSLDGDFGAQKSYAIESAKNDWVFILDADERITPSLKKEIVEALNTGQMKSYALRRENHFYDKKVTHGVLRADWVVRLFPKKNSRYEGLVHERLETPYELKKFSSYLIHYPYKNWEANLQKVNHYTKIASEKYFNEGRRCHFVRDILIKPLWAFLKVYFLNLGFLDGKLGWIFSINHAFYTMMKYVRLMELEMREKLKGTSKN